MLVSRPYLKMNNLFLIFSSLGMIGIALPFRTTMAGTIIGLCGFILLALHTLPYLADLIYKKIK